MDKVWKFIQEHFLKLTQMEMFVIFRYQDKVYYLVIENMTR